MDSGAAALLGALIGGLTTACGTFAFDWWADRKKRRNLSIAAAGEISALAEMVRRRKYLEAIIDNANEAARGNVLCLKVKLPPEILPVSRAFMLQAGVLGGRVPILLPRVVMTADALAADFNRLMNCGMDEKDSVLLSSAPKAAQAFYAEMLGVLLTALEVADELVFEVRRQYPDVQIVVGTQGLAEIACRKTIQTTA